MDEGLNTTNNMDDKLPPIENLEMEEKTEASNFHESAINRINDSMTREFGELSEIEKRLIAKTYHEMQLIAPDAKLTEIEKTEQVFNKIKEALKKYRAENAV